MGLLELAKEQNDWWQQDELPVSEVVSPVFSLFAMVQGSKTVFQLKNKMTGEVSFVDKHIHNKFVYVPDLTAKKVELSRKEEINIYQNQMIEKEFEVAENNKTAPTDTIKGLKARVQSLIYSSPIDWMQITELIKNYMVEKEHIFTTRHDERPEMWIYREGIYIPEGKTYINEVCKDVLGGFLTPQRCNNIIFKVECNTYIDQDEFFENKYIDLVPVENGLLNILTRELQQFDPKKVFFNKLNFDFDKAAVCPNIKKHFNKVLKQDDLNLMQEIFGYLLYKDYKFEKAFMFTGGGRNGKGKTVELMKRFIGADNCCNVTLQQIESDQFALANFHGKMANLGADISSTGLKETGNFKSLTGHDLISANRKNKTYINFVNYAKMVFCANEMPRSMDLTIAFFNRWVLVDFNKTFVSQAEYDKLCIDKTEPKILKNYEVADPELINKLSCKKELSGLLNWALVGLDRMMKNKQLSYSKTTEETKGIWIRKTDSLMAFIEDSCEIDYEGSITKDSFRESYKKYCITHKIRPFTDLTIKKTLQTKYDLWEERQRLGEMQLAVWKGIKFKVSKAS